MSIKMKTRSWNKQDIVSIVRNIAKEELLPRFSKIKSNKKDDGSLITEADLAVQNRIDAELKKLDADILFLGEEMSVEMQQDILQQKNKSIWVLDPLDGTTNFAAGIPYYAVSLALIENGQVELGVVYDPERDECFIAEKNSGAFLQLSDFEYENLNTNDDQIKLSDAVACIDLKRLPEQLAMKIVSNHPFRSQRSFGGVALDWCWLPAGRFDVYLHGKQNIWDYAAGHLIFTEAGGRSCTLQDEPVFINELTPRVGIGALDSALFDEWTAWLDVTSSK